MPRVMIDGREVEITGVVSEKNGHKAITARSIDVKIEGVPIEGTKKSEKE